MKKSRQVALVLLTTLTFSACAKKKDETVRDLTVHGWTNSQDTISTIYRPYYHSYYGGFIPFFIFHNSGYSYFRRGGFYGPEVSAFRSTSHAYSSGGAAVRSSAISRGGFGSLGHSSAS